MQIQISTDKNVHGSEELIQRLEAELQSTLSRFSEHITRLEVHLSDEVSTGAGSVDRRCVIEAPFASSKACSKPSPDERTTARAGSPSGT
ncbi:hypothetical protein [Amycolatopsis circi]|uniref:hypothetical protein n=1 Tax=Amycolatopsis circi TaxID=871959 RepID=UPI001FCA3C0D|nr:hypothetical protein [Amycolatopsis circi]